MFRRKWIVGSAAVAVLATGGAVAWDRSRIAPPPPALQPAEIPESVLDAEVREALTAARAKVIAEPRSGAAWGELGLTYRAHGLNGQSNICFAEAARLDPADCRWPYLIGLIDLLIAPDDAVRHLRTANDLAIESEFKSAARLRLAEALFERGDSDGAERLFAEERRANPLNPRAHFGLGAVASTRGEFRIAIDHLGRAASSPFSRRKANGLLAASHRQVGNAAEAERCEREAGTGPQDLPWRDPFIAEYARLEAGRSARLKEVEAFEAGGRIMQAVLVLEELARQNPDDQTLVSLGINRAKIGQYAPAEDALRAVLARTPDHAVGRYFLGISLYMQAEAAWKAGDKARAEPQFRDAIKELRRAAELKPDKGLAHLYAGLALKYLGDLAAAADECREAVRASPQFADPHLALGEVLVVWRKPTEAIPHLEAAARLAAAGDVRAKALLEKVRGGKR